MPLVTRSIKLGIAPNSGKMEEARYTFCRHLKWVQHFVIQLYFYRFLRFFSTKGCGQLANQAQHKAIGILNAHWASVKETKAKSNAPRMKNAGCPAKIEKSKKSKHFDSWLSVESQFGAKKRVNIPVLTHKCLGKWLKRGYELSAAAQDPKDLANLQPKGKVAAWARSYFSQRMQTLAEERGVYVSCVPPAGTSTTCYSGMYRSKENRDGRAFKCRKCHYKAHADLNAARNRARSGRREIEKILLSRSGRIHNAASPCSG